MKILPEKFVKKGFKHSLVKRQDNVAIYKRSQVGSGAKPHYEVVIVTSHNGITIEGNYIEPGELYPSTSQWGQTGWTCSTIEDANKRFEMTLKQVERSAKNKEKKLSLAQKKKK
jgi:hypothetical protein